ncbi:MAG: glutamate-cysteine ligase family protein [Thermodesulfobacteriota bacterium]
MDKDIQRVVMHEAIQYLLDRFEQIEAKRRTTTGARRIGVELKFPLVDLTGGAASFSKTKELWSFLTNDGWEGILDPLTKEIIGVKKSGEMNETFASCETGFCKIEFSLAHAGDLHQLFSSIHDLLKTLKRFSKEYEVAFLCYGIQPLALPGKHLLMKKSRNIFWDSLFGGNSIISPEDGTDVHLFTVTASNQVHVDVNREETVDAINVLNGLAGAQIALTANSNVWQGRIDPVHKCVGEVFWDWWLKKQDGRFGVPLRRFHDLEDYIASILDFPPVYIKRGSEPIGLPHCPSFGAFYSCSTENRCQEGFRVEGCGLTTDGMPTEVTPENFDLDHHLTFFWHNARLSRYFTLENRCNDQQPPDGIMAVPALTLGLMENLNAAVDLINQYPWGVLRESRIQAACSGLDAKVEGVPISQLSRGMVEIAEAGLKKRGLKEEIFLAPLKERLEEGYCPADAAAEIFRSEGVEGLVGRLKIK